MLTGYPNVITFECGEKILWQMKNTICKTKIGNELGSGFFCKIPFPSKDKLLPVFITNNHIINEKMLYNKDESFNIKIKDKNLKKINLNKRIKYTNEKYDVTIIGLNDEDEINDYLELDESIFNGIINNKNDNDDFVDKTVYIIQYPEGILSLSLGIIQSICLDKPYDFNHKCNTKVGSSGSPILGLNNKVIGLHKKGTKTFNIGTFLNYPIKDFIKQNFNKDIKNNNNKRGLIGLNNLRVCWFMNPTLQCLSNTKLLTKFFLDNYTADPNKKLSNEYYKLLINLWQTNLENVTYTPISFKDTLIQMYPLFKEIRTNRAKDLIIFLIEKFHKELKINNTKKQVNNPSIEEQLNESLMLKFFDNDLKQNENSAIFKLFYSKIESKAECLNCRNITYNFRFKNIFDFTLDLVNEHLIKEGKKTLTAKEGKNIDIDLYECFEYYINPILMEGDNKMYCNICEKELDTYFTELIYSTSNYLIINLNKGKKNEYKVNFPDKLNINNYVINKDGFTNYELYAIISYYTPYKQEGHFVAFCRSRTDNQWYLYDDEIVTKCSNPYDYDGWIPYILFYEAVQ